jgi:hypothetical protein
MIGSSLSTADAEAVLRSAEAELLDVRVDGWAAWPLLRLASGYSLEQLQPGPRARLAPGSRMKLAVRDLLNLRRVCTADLLVKSVVSGLLDASAGGYRDAWFDGFLDVFDNRVLVVGINSPGLLDRLDQARHQPDLSTVLVDGIAAAAGRFQPPRGVDRSARRISTLLRGALGDDALPEVAVRASLLRFYWTKRGYGMLLDRVRPRLVLTADPGEFALVAAAKERGILVYELQHGSIDRNHHGYGWTDAARPFRQVMPIADRLLLYGDHWKEELDANGFWGDTAQVVGSLRIDSFRSRRSAPDGSVYRVVITSQGIDSDGLARFLTQALNASRNSRLRLVVKLHPAYEQSKMSYLEPLGKDERVTLLLGSEGESTFELLTRADLHLSISSTVHYEALGLGVPTAVVPLATHEIVLPLCEAGHAHLLQGPAELAALFDAGPPERVESDVSFHYFAPGALRALNALVAPQRPAPPKGAGMRGSV